MDPIQLPLGVVVFGGFFLFLGGAFLGARFFSIRIDESFFQDQLPNAVRGLPAGLAKRWAKELLDWSRSLDEKATRTMPCLVDWTHEGCGLQPVAKPVPPPDDIHPSIRAFERFVGAGLAVCDVPRTTVHKPEFFQEHEVPGFPPSRIICCVADGVEAVDDPWMAVDPESGRCYVYTATDEDEDVEVFPTAFHGLLYLYLDECAGAAEMEKTKSDQS